MLSQVPFFEQEKENDATVEGRTELACLCPLTQKIINHELEAKPRI